MPIPRTIFNDKFSTDVDVAGEFDADIGRRIDLNVRANADDSVGIFVLRYVDLIGDIMTYPGI